MRDKCQLRFASAEGPAPDPQVRRPRQIGTKTAIIDGKSYTVRVFEPRPAQQVTPVNTDAVAPLRLRSELATSASRSASVGRASTHPGRRK